MSTTHAESVARSVAAVQAAVETIAAGGGHVDVRPPPPLDEALRLLRECYVGHWRDGRWDVPRLRRVSALYDAVRRRVTTGVGLPEWAGATPLQRGAWPDITALWRSCAAWPDALPDLPSGAELVAQVMSEAPPCPWWVGGHGAGLMPGEASPGSQWTGD